AAVNIRHRQAFAARARAVVIARRPALQADLAEANASIRADVLVKEIVHGVIGDIDVRLAVAVQIDGHDSKSLTAIVALAQARILADVGEGAVAVIAKDQVPQAAKPFWRSKIAPLTVHAHRFILGRPIHVLANVQVRQAVAVEVRTGDSGGPDVLREAS